MSGHILAVLSHEHLKVGHSLRLETVLRFFLAGQQGREVLLHLGEMVDKIEAGLLEVVELLEEAPLLDGLRRFGALVGVRPLVVLEMLVQQLRQFLYYLAI